jgi:thymidylate kinase
MICTVVDRACREAAGERLFRALVSGLEACGARHAFLRGFDSYPSLRAGSDVDLLVHPRDRSQVEALFRELAEREGFHIWQRFRSGFITRLYAYVFDPEAGHVFFDLDLHTSEASYGVAYFDAESLLGEATQGAGPRHLSSPVGAMVNALGHLFMGGAIPAKYKRAWIEAGSTVESESLLERAVGAADRAAIEASLEDGDEPLPGRSIGSRTRRRMLLRHPLRSVLGFVAFAFGERVRPWFSPRGRFVIFAGTDGSGKTTLVRELLARIGPRFRDGAVEEHHLRPGVIPQLSALFHGGKPAYSIEDMSDPHRATPSGFVGSSLRTLYYWVDYFVGYPLRILPRRRRNSLIIYDRWFYDHVVDPRRFRIALGHPLPAMLKRFLARPDRLVVCTAEPATVLERKQELAPEEVARQVDEFQAFAARESRAILVNTTASVDECVDQIIRSVFGGASS